MSINLPFDTFVEEHDADNSRNQYVGKKSEAKTSDALIPYHYLQFYETID
jgi:hypothetical protein